MCKNSALRRSIATGFGNCSYFQDACRRYRKSRGRFKLPGIHCEVLRVNHDSTNVYAPTLLDCPDICTSLHSLDFPRHHVEQDPQQFCSQYVKP